MHQINSSSYFFFAPLPLQLQLLCTTTLFHFQFSRFFAKKLVLGPLTLSLHETRDTVELCAVKSQHPQVKTIKESKISNAHKEVVNLG